MKLAWDSKKSRSVRTGYHRERSDSPYHTDRWTRLSRTFRALHPLCAECARNGIVKASECVDHVIPWPAWKRMGGDFFDTANLQALCHDCNVTKGNRDRERLKVWRPGMRW